MATQTLQNGMNMQVDQATSPVQRPAIKLKVTTAAIGGSALKRWSIVWGK